MIASIYHIKNTSNGNLYIGSSNHLKARWNLHRSDLRNNRHHSRHLQNAWNKYGEDSFEFLVIETCLVQDKLVREQHYLDTVKPVYNMSHLATGGSGFSLSEDTKDKIRRKATGRMVSEETRRKISEALKGRKLAKQHVDRIKSHPNGMLGKTHSKETRQKISLALISKNKI